MTSTPDSNVISSADPSTSLTASQVVRVTEPWPGVLRAVIDNPPFNLFTPAVFAGLRLLQQYVDNPANGIRVVIIESANPDFFIAHVDFSQLSNIPDIPGAVSVVENWPAFAAWLSSVPVLTITKFAAGLEASAPNWLLPPIFVLPAAKMPSYARLKSALDSCREAVGLNGYPDMSAVAGHSRSSLVLKTMMP